MTTHIYTDQEPRYFDPRNDVAFKKVFVDHESLTKSFLNATLRLIREMHRLLFQLSCRFVEILPNRAQVSIFAGNCTDKDE